ncbi:MAG: 4-hydroxythreonine-4-phosphate dehydrogenase PdxA [Gemmatimonadetes bacterium]|nr:4-hydroxythreonine-4-phosphate dehydrogenase PdxA [Gemmatimonadota bacterium]
MSGSERPSGTARLALTLGDPRGIGPEVVRKALVQLAGELADVTVLGPAGSGPGIPRYHAVGSFDGTESSAGCAAAAALRRAVEMALADEVDAIVTGPAHKHALHAAGWAYPGQTEMLKALTGAPAVAMLMAAEHTRVGPPLRVLLATTHIALRRVPGAVTSELLVEQARLAYHALARDWRIPEPRLALCALNPHASDGGLFGDEEARTLEPAVAALGAAGIRVAGPIPADTVFHRALEGEFDVVIAPYHDVGMAAFKTVSFGAGVNVTLGLPFIRTSPDHGTAFDLAGLGRADPSSMVEAIRLAARLDANRFDTASPRA